MTTQHNMPPMPSIRESDDFTDFMEDIERYGTSRGTTRKAIRKSILDTIDARVVNFARFARAHAADLAEKVRGLEAEVSEWRKLRDPTALHVNLLRGQPARLQARELLHVAGYTQSEVDAALAAARQPVEAEPVLYVRQVDLDWIRNRYPKGGITAYRSASEEWKVPLYLAAQQPATVDRDAVLEEARDALKSLLWQFTTTPSTLKDSNARAQGHEAIKAIDAALSQQERKEGEKAK